MYTGIGTGSDLYIFPVQLFKAPKHNPSKKKKFKGFVECFTHFFFCNFLGTAATCVVYILQVKNFVYILFSGPGGYKLSSG